MTGYGNRHETSCDHTTLGWTVLRVEEEQGPQLCVTVSELRRAREEYRDAGLVPKCDCESRQLKEIQSRIDRARKAGDAELRAELLHEKREVVQAWAIDRARTLTRR